MAATFCPECHHTPSGRTADYGATCHCQCHDVADASPDLLAACRAAFGSLTNPGAKGNPTHAQLLVQLQSAIAKAQP